MSDITPIGQTNAASLARSGPATAPAAAPSLPARSADKVEFSDTARLLSQLAKLPAVRADLVEQVRAQIADNTYDTPERLDKALDAMINDFTGQR